MRPAGTLGLDRPSTGVPHSRTVSALARVDAEGLVRYLYADFDTTCPALVDVLEVSQSLDRADSHRMRSQAD